MKRLKRNNDGFTLIELCITISLVGLVFLVIAGIYVTVVKAREVSEGTIDTAHDVQMITTYFADDIQGATNLPLNGALPQSITIRDFNSPTAEFTRTITYSLAGKELKRGSQTLAACINSASMATTGSTVTLTMVTCTDTTPITIKATRRL